jgi:hypothetical protein
MAARPEAHRYYLSSDARSELSSLVTRELLAARREAQC